MVFEITIDSGTVMKTDLARRQFLTCGSLLAAASVAPSLAAGGPIRRNPGTKIKLALNAYSFNRPLRDGRMTLFDVVDYCAEHDFSGLDATGYYFPGYPEPPSDEYIYKLKHRAFVNGITICGTGVRNDFAVPDSSRRAKDVSLVKHWTEVAQKLGATELRVFSGREVPSGYTFATTLEWMATDFRECSEYAQNHGVMLGLQNHHDFVKTADETIQLVEAVDSDWFAVKLDIGSLRQGDPYREIEKLAPYAISWQIKENVWFGHREVPTDYARIKMIVDRAGYRGFLPLETLGAGDPKIKVAKMLKQVRPLFPAAT